MATFLLDTSVIIDAINDKKNRRQFLRDLIQQGNILACCPSEPGSAELGVFCTTPRL